MSVNVFRGIILIAAIVYLVLLVLPFFDKYILSEQESVLFTYVGYKALLGFPDTILWVFVFLWYVFIAGLFIFQDWARIGFAGWLVISSAATFFSGMEILTAYEFFLLNISNILDGVIISVSFFSSIKDEFT